MPVVTKQDLHLAKSLDELRKKSESLILKKRFTDVERLIETSLMLYDKAKDELRKGDDEVAYMMLFRFMSLLDFLTNEKDKKIFLNRIGSKVTEVIDHLEILAKQLPLRYEERQKSYENRKAQLFDQPKTSIPGTSIKIDIKKSVLLIEDDDNDEYKTITSTELVQSLQSLSEINKILIIDIRSTEEFNESSIAANKIHVTGEVNLINIPHDIIIPSLTINKLRKQLQFGRTLNALERRRSMDRVVIIDATTKQFDKSSKSIILADALFKWDSESPDRIKAKPLLLKGGYADFVITFGPYTSNSDIIHKYSEVNLQDRFDINNLANKCCYEFDEKPQQTVTRNPTKERSLSANIEPFLNDNETKLNNSKNSFFQNQIHQFSNNLNEFKVPGVAKPVIPDRSSKPRTEFSNIYNFNGNTDIKNNGDKMINVDKELKSLKFNQPKIINQKNNFSINGIANSNNSLKNVSEMREALPPKPVHLLSSLSNHNRTVNGSIDRHDSIENKLMDIEGDLYIAAKFEDEQELCSKNDPVIPFKPGQIFEFDEDMEVEEEKDKSINNENSPPPSPPIAVGKRSSFSSSLSRSLSSPNIAQLEPQDQSYHSVGSPKFSSQIPIVDRTVKPLLPYQAAQYKTRDFNPQFSSCARITGLRNLGNTCFMNAILQCLNNTTELTEYLRSGNVHINPTSKFGSNGELTIELIELFKQMLYPSNYKHISPRDFKTAVIRHIPDFIEYKQQDAHEFLVRFLDRVHADLNRSKPSSNFVDPVIKDPNCYDKLSISAAANSFWTTHLMRNESIITDLFEGLIVSTLRCMHCDYSSKTLEAFTCLTLPIPDDRTSLRNCIDLFLRGERITNEAAWQCQQCKQKRDAQKCTYIWKLPKVLIIHLKRFTYDGIWRQKIYTFVDFPLENLKLEARKGENHTYSLYGVVNHTGSLEGGHYISFSRNKDYNIGWHRYDDQDVSPVPATDVITQNAYVLFYKSTSHNNSL